MIQRDAHEKAQLAYRRQAALPQCVHLNIKLCGR
jgi:hypothetical protein